MRSRDYLALFEPNPQALTVDLFDRLWGGGEVACRVGDCQEGFLKGLPLSGDVAVPR